MTGEIVSTHGECPNCGAHDAYTDFGEGRGFCHSEGKNIFTKEYVRVEDKKVSSITYEGIRGIDPDVAKFYGIQLQLGEDGKPVRYAYKYPHTTKYRDFNNKKNTWLKDVGAGMLNFFGPEFNAGSSKRIYITEGEFDAASLYQAMGKTYPVISVPSASIGDKFIVKNHSYLSSFEQVVWAGDQDEAGKKCADRIYKAIPERFYYIPMTKWKDANEAIQKGDQDELKWAALKPQRWAPDNFFCSDDAVLKALREESPYSFSPTGHSGLDEKIKGLVVGGLTFILAPPGSGKTSLFRFLETEQLKKTDHKIGILHMEEQKSTTYRGMASYELGKNVNTKEDAKDSGVTEEKVEEAAIAATKGDRTVVFEMRSGDDPMELISYIRLAAGVYGCRYIFVDHIQRLAYMGGVDGATNILTRLASNLANLAKELEIGIVFISHVNEDGHTKYARSLEEEAIIVIRIERDKEATDPEIRNVTKVHVTKNRPYSKLGYAGAFFYNEDTTIMREYVE